MSAFQVDSTVPSAKIAVEIDSSMLSVLKDYRGISRDCRGNLKVIGANLRATRGILRITGAF